MARFDTAMTVTISNASEMAERFGALSVLSAKIAGHYEDMAKEMRALASMGGKDAESIEETKSIGDAVTESAP